jgi:hypothetical protein
MLATPFVKEVHILQAPSFAFRVRRISAYAEAEIAAKFVEAAQLYENHPGPLKLRAMNIIYEATKERGATMLIPGSMVDSLNPPLALEIAGRDVARATLTPFKAAA